MVLSGISLSYYTVNFMCIFEIILIVIAILYCVHFNICLKFNISLLKYIIRESKNVLFQQQARRLSLIPELVLAVVYWKCKLHEKS